MIAIISVPCDHPRLELFGTEPGRRLAAGASLFLRDDPLRVPRARGERRARPYAGKRVELTLHVAGPDELVAGAFLFAERYHCDGTCRTDVVPAVVRRNTLLERLDRDRALAALAASAREVQSLRSRIEVLRLRRLADRLHAYRTLRGPPGEGGWVGVAD